MGKKGTFDSPRAVGTVEEIRVSSLKIRFVETETGNQFRIDAEIHEGNDVAGVFEVSEKGSVEVLESDLSVPNKVALESMLSVIINIYVNARGYSGVTIG